MAGRMIWAAAEIREDFVPLPGSGQVVGPAYTSHMIEFIQDVERGWRPEVAAANCTSLRRCMDAIAHLIEQPYGVADDQGDYSITQHS